MNDAADHDATDGDAASGEGGHSDGHGASEHATGDAAGEAASAAQRPAQIFQVTISLRDDWLHRGDALQDMDLQTYAESIERQAKPICGQDRWALSTIPA